MIEQLDGNSIYKCGALLKLLFLVPYLHAIQTKVGLSKIDIGKILCIRQDLMLSF